MENKIIRNKTQSMDNVRYHSMLNAIEKEFESSAKGTTHATQKRMLSLAMGIIDAFATIYGEHNLKNASSAISRELATRKLFEN